MIIRVSSQFRRAYSKLPERVRARAKERVNVFMANPFDRQLNTHKLHGKYKDYWAFTITGQYRIMFAFVNSDKVDFINIGTHDIYK
ncbi:type II toxin-antitoxin system mRNA interferase toxin, RelE/StbE family [Candidatus Parcubacteria bacterium]|nr:type II toxin-antitoxin system mRNA interferase toxin, RelE/StbE family [Candidatus Parcubacteria bacterium]